MSELKRKAEKIAEKLTDKYYQSNIALKGSPNFHEFRKITAEVIESALQSECEELERENQRLKELALDNAMTFPQLEPLIKNRVKNYEWKIQTLESKMKELECEQTATFVLGLKEEIERLYRENERLKLSLSRWLESSSLSPEELASLKSDLSEAVQSMKNCANPETHDDLVRRLGSTT